MKQITDKNYSEVMPEAKVAIQEFTQNMRVQTCGVVVDEMTLNAFGVMAKVYGHEHQQRIIVTTWEHDTENSPQVVREYVMTWDAEKEAFVNVEPREEKAKSRASLRDINLQVNDRDGFKAFSEKYHKDHGKLKAKAISIHYPFSRSKRWPIEEREYTLYELLCKTSNIMNDAASKDAIAAPHDLDDFYIEMITTRRDTIYVAFGS